jgi:3-(3-hydroxy-phenyl)propionate hydroxylase
MEDVAESGATRLGHGTDAPLGDGFVYPRYPYVAPPELNGRGRRRYSVVVVGAGMVGLTAAVDLGVHGIDCVLLDDNDTVSTGSRSIGQSRKSVQIWDRLGCAEEMKALGRPWSRAKQFFGDRLVYEYAFDRDEDNFAAPMMVLPQYRVESILVERCAGLPSVEVRWKNRVKRVTQTDDGVTVDIATPDGDYQIEADWLIAADGIRSTVRQSLGLPFSGRKVGDRFIIADVMTDVDLPPERMFWFKPRFHAGNSTLCLRQIGGICRVDWNLGPDADPEEEKRVEKVLPRLHAMFGTEARYDVEWISVYTVEMRRLARFRHGRIFFAGDAAHQLSPFGGGRGGNSGIQDVDNLVWKLSAVIRGEASGDLLDSYDDERGPVTDENLKYSVQATEFITPTSAASAAFQEAVLTLSASMPFARVFINSGRFSKAAPLVDSRLSTPDTDQFAANLAAPGSPALDAPVIAEKGDDWLIRHLGSEFALMLYRPEKTGPAIADLRATLAALHPPVRLIVVTDAVDGESGGMLVDTNGSIADQYDCQPDTAYLFRPDQHVAARWRKVDTGTIAESLARACGAEYRPGGRSGGDIVRAPSEDGDETSRA